MPYCQKLGNLQIPVFNTGITIPASGFNGRPMLSVGSTNAACVTSMYNTKTNNGNAGVFDFTGYQFVQGGVYTTKIGPSPLANNMQQSNWLNVLNVNNNFLIPASNTNAQPNYGVGFSAFNSYGNSTLPPQGYVLKQINVPGPTFQYGPEKMYLCTVYPLGGYIAQMQAQVMWNMAGWFGGVRFAPFNFHTGAFFQLAGYNTIAPNTMGNGYYFGANVPMWKTGVNYWMAPGVAGNARQPYVVPWAYYMTPSGGTPQIIVDPTIVGWSPVTFDDPYLNQYTQSAGYSGDFSPGPLGWIFTTNQNNPTQARQFFITPDWTGYYEIFLRPQAGAPNIYAGMRSDPVGVAGGVNSVDNSMIDVNGIYWYLYRNNDGSYTMLNSKGFFIPGLTPPVIPQFPPFSLPCWSECLGGNKVLAKDYS